MAESVCDAYWEGPFPWNERRKHTESHHVLYALYGTHHLYGKGVLLYIGSTEGDVADRLSQHRWWVDEEYDPMTVKIASIGVHNSIEEWSKAYDKMRDDDHYPKAEPEIVRGVEALLIYAHQPAYNTSSKVSLEAGRGLRVLNTGRCGLLLPELSFAYYEPYD